MPMVMRGVPRWVMFDEDTGSKPANAPHLHTHTHTHHPSKRTGLLLTRENPFQAPFPPAENTDALISQSWPTNSV